MRVREGENMDILKRNTVHIANSLVDDWSAHARYPVSDGETIYLYDEGFYKPLANIHGYVMRMCEGLDVGRSQLSLSWGKITEIVKSCLCHTEIYDPLFFEDTVVGIGTNEGFFVPTKDKPSFLHPSERHRLRACHGETINFDPPKAFLAFLGQLFRGDSDRKDKERVIQEILGCALSGVSVSRAALFLGAGSNGKSTLQALMTKIVGEEWTTNVEPKHLGQGSTSAYYLSLLAKSKFNVAGELDANAFKHSSSEIKNLISGDRISVRSPYQNPVSIQPKGVHCFSSNFYPEFHDATKGFSRRLCLLGFNNSFEGRNKRFEDIWYRIEKEIPSILGFALLGTCRVLARGDLTIPSSSKTLTEIVKLDDPIHDFFTTACDLEEEGETKASEVYVDFVKFVGRRQLNWDGSATKFGRRFTELLANVVRGHPKRRIGGYTYYRVAIRPHTTWDSDQPLN
ncbi:MAG: hypothetical protein CL547_11725 [Alcanivorax sp.]|nr:hypothetical protein [Alcanivorax sp.]